MRLIDGLNVCLHASIDAWRSAVSQRPAAIVQRHIGLGMAAREWESPEHVPSKVAVCRVRLRRLELIATLTPDVRAICRFASVPVSPRRRQRRVTREERLYTYLVILRARVYDFEPLICPTIRHYKSPQFHTFIHILLILLSSHIFVFTIWIHFYLIAFLCHGANVKVKVNVK